MVVIGAVPTQFDVCSFALGFHFWNSLNLLSIWSGSARCQEVRWGRRAGRDAEGKSVRDARGKWIFLDNRWGHSDARVLGYGGFTLVFRTQGLNVRIHFCSRLVGHSVCEHAPVVRNGMSVILTYSVLEAAADTWHFHAGNYVHRG